METLPKYNVFDVIPISTFWSYVDSILSIGLPFFLIDAALFVVGLILYLIIKTFRKSSDSEDSDDSEDDDWD